MAQIGHESRLICDVRGAVPLTAALRYLLIPSETAGPSCQYLCVFLCSFSAVISLPWEGRGWPKAFTGSCDAQLFCYFSAWPGEK